jgi:hypothetical protein
MNFQAFQEIVPTPSDFAWCRCSSLLLSSVEPAGSTSDGWIERPVISNIKCSDWLFLLQTKYTAVKSCPPDSHLVCYQTHQLENKLPALSCSDYFFFSICFWVWFMLILLHQWTIWNSACVYCSIPNFHAVILVLYLWTTFCLNTTTIIIYGSTIDIDSKSRPQTHHICYWQK